jgi:hypothetical protein
MSNTEKSAFVEAIIDGFKKMRELGYCNETRIYTVGVSGGLITSPGGKLSIETKYVTISRVIKRKKNIIKIYCCEAKRDFTIQVDTEQQIEKAVSWMLDKDIMPSLKSMRTLVIPSQSISF